MMMTMVVVVMAVMTVVAVVMAVMTVVEVVMVVMVMPVHLGPIDLRSLVRRTNPAVHVTTAITDTENL